MTPLGATRLEVRASPGKIATTRRRIITDAIAAASDEGRYADFFAASCSVTASTVSMFAGLRYM